MAMLMPGACAHAAAYLPGLPDSDPPTGDVATATPVSAEPLAGGGIRWELAPWRYGGTLSLEGGWQRQDGGARSQHGVAYGDLDFASYIWQPWFIQLRAGLGMVLARDEAGGDSAAAAADTTSATGRFAISAFPASRFPFVFRLDVTDSRTSGETLGIDYRSHRASLSQGWRPLLGSSNVQLNYDFSRLTTTDGRSDTLTVLQATGTHQWNAHSFELGADLSGNERTDTEEQSRLDTLTARHSYRPTQDLQVDTLATFNDVKLRSAAGIEGGTDARQVSTLLSWRPREGEWLHAPDAPLQLTASARWVDASANVNGQTLNEAQALNATLGVTKDLSRTLRVAGTASLGRFVSGATDHVDTSSLAASATWTPTALPLGLWQYAPTATASTGLEQNSADGGRHLAGLQLAHTLSRNFALGEDQSLALNLTQSAASLSTSGQDEVINAFANGASLFWQTYGGSGEQTYAGLSVTDARTWADVDGRFQIVNLQLTRRTPLSRSASWSANLTLQGSRYEATAVDPFTGSPRPLGQGWQQFHSGTVSYQNQQAFGVPRLRLTLLLSANSQQLERRSAGDIDAPLERISESLEARFDYIIGRLEARLTARMERIGNGTHSAVFARLQRRF
jgi:hypothetical protein